MRWAVVPIPRANGPLILELPLRFIARCFASSHSPFRGCIDQSEGLIYMHRKGKISQPPPWPITIAFKCSLSSSSRFVFMTIDLPLMGSNGKDDSVDDVDDGQR